MRALSHCARLVAGRTHPVDDDNDDDDWVFGSLYSSFTWGTAQAAELHHYFSLILTNGPVRCEASLHGDGKSLV